MAPDRTTRRPGAALDYRLRPPADSLLAGAVVAASPMKHRPLTSSPRARVGENCLDFNGRVAATSVTTACPVRGRACPLLARTGFARVEVDRRTPRPGIPDGARQRGVVRGMTCRTTPTRRYHPLRTMRTDEVPLVGIPPIGPAAARLRRSGEVRHHRCLAVRPKRACLISAVHGPDGDEVRSSFSSRPQWAPDPPAGSAATDRQRRSVRR